MQDFFKILKPKIENAAKKCFDENYAKFGSDICSFALVSDDGAMTVVPFTNTISYLHKLQSEDPEFRDDYAYNPSEWLSSKGADLEFDEICELLRNELKKDYLDFSLFKKELFKTCVDVLNSLRSKLFFKKILKKEIFLLFDVTDTFETDEKLTEWVKKLNDEKIALNFKKWIEQ